MSKKLYDNVKHVISLRTAVVTTDTAGQAYVDTKGYRDGLLIVPTGAITATGTDVYTLTVYEGDTTASMTTTGISVTFGYVSAAAESNTVKVARIADLNVTRKRYLQVRLAASATTVSYGGAGIIALGSPASAPVN